MIDAIRRAQDEHDTTGPLKGETLAQWCAREKSCPPDWTQLLADGPPDESRPIKLIDGSAIRVYRGQVTVAA